MVGLGGWRALWLVLALFAMVSGVWWLASPDQETANLPEPPRSSQPLPESAGGNASSEPDRPSHEPAGAAEISRIEVARNGRDPGPERRFPEIDGDRLIERFRGAQSREEWASVVIDNTFFHVVFGPLRDRELEPPVDLSDPSVNPEGKTLSATEQSRLSALLEPVSREIHDARCFYDVEKYYAFQESLARAPTILTEAALSGMSQSEFIDDLARASGGHDSFEHFLSSAFTRPHRPTDTLEALMSESGAPAKQPMRVYWFARTDAPNVFLARDRMNELLGRRRDMARGFVQSLPPR